MRAVDAVEWACALCDHHIQNDWGSRAMNLHPILHEAWTFFCRNYSDDSQGCSYGQLMIGNQSPCQCVHSYIMFHADFFCKTANRPGDSASHSPDLACCDFLLFPKLKLPLKGKRFQTIDEIQENTTAQLMAVGRTVWGPKVPTLKGTEASLSYV